jgi:uncharacterized repeat protein (TIGR03803 family)
MRSHSVAIIAAMIVLLGANAFAASNEKVLHTFSGGTTDGSYPVAGLIADSAGNLYGTTRYGGASGDGTVFKLSLLNGSWNETVLYSFAGGSDGISPAASLVMDSAGNLFGTTRLGGPDSAGTIFELSFSGGSWKESVLYSFTGGADGGSPQAALVIRGNVLLGATPQGGANGNGTVFYLAHLNGKWTEKVLYSFAGGNTDGAYPYSALIFDRTGNLYGTTESGGPNEAGSVFELSQSGGKWTEKVLYFFTGNTDGGTLDAGVIFDNAGNLYGTTASGGKYSTGTVFELTPSSGSWTESVLYNFTGGADGGFPSAGLSMDANGNLFSTTYTGGASKAGTVFQLTPSAGAWTETVLYSFSGGNDGGFPTSTVLLYKGFKIGTTIEGGSSQEGVVFKVGRLISAPSYCNPCLFYGGDFDVSSPAADTFANENIIPGNFPTLSQIYSPFQVPAGETWQVTGLFINSIAYPTALDPVATPWEIRTGIPINGGNGGTLVASGSANGTMTATGRNLNGVPEYTILVTLTTPVILSPGIYWENVTPQCTNSNNSQCTAQGFTGFLESDMETMYGLNAYGPSEPWRDSFWNSQLFGLNWENTYQVHQQRGEPGGDAFSAGVIGTK